MHLMRFRAPLSLKNFLFAVKNQANLLGLAFSGNAKMCSTKRGAFIVFEGCDRVGKSTQSLKLVHALKSEGSPAEHFSFPDRSTNSGRVIGSYLEGKCRMEDHAIHLLFSANRWESVPKLLTLLSSGINVVVDRYAFSGVAFSAAKQGIDWEWCKWPDVGLPKPDLVIFLHLEPSLAEQRGGFGKELYENKQFQEIVSGNYRKLQDSSWQAINADMEVQELHEIIKVHVHHTMKHLTPEVQRLWVTQEQHV